MTAIEDRAAATAASPTGGIPFPAAQPAVFRRQSGCRAYRGPLARLMGPHIAAAPTTGRKTGLPRRTASRSSRSTATTWCWPAWAPAATGTRTCSAQPRVESADRRPTVRRHGGAGARSREPAGCWHRGSRRNGTASVRLVRCGGCCVAGCASTSTPNWLARWHTPRTCPWSK